MAAPKRTPTQRENDLEKIAAFYLKGMRQADIAQQIGVDQSQISRDLKTVHARWRESAMVNMNEVKHRELARIDELERTYWDAWARSMNETVKTRTEKESNGATKASVAKESQVGNPTYLSGVQWCIEQRCKIFGLYEAAKISIDWRKAVEEQGQNAGELFERMVNAYISAANGNAT